MLRRIEAESLQTNVALKLTHLGVLFDEDSRFRNAERLVAEAARLGNFIRIDMEDSSLVDVTLRIYRRLREAGHDNVGTVLQSYLYRTEADLESLLPLQPNLRIVKGAYKEPAERRVPEEDGRRYRVRAASSSALDRRRRFHRGRHARRELIEHALSTRTPVPSASSCRCSTGCRTQLQLDLVARGHAVFSSRRPSGRTGTPT